MRPANTGLKRELWTAEVTDIIRLNSNKSDKETIHLSLRFEGQVPLYEPGDFLKLFPENDPALVHEVLVGTGLAADEALRAALIGERDITALSVNTLESFAVQTGDGRVRDLLDSGQAQAWVEERQLIDLIEAFPAALTPEQLVELTRPLSPRAYSIASSRKQVGDEAHLLIARVRYKMNNRDRNGVASSFVASRLETGAKIHVRHKPSRRFRLPDPATDIIMIGPGTGVAPFRAFIQERRAVGASGRSWLFFGNRRYAHDFLYQGEWHNALADGSLTRIDLAFSRDTSERIYVQHRLWQRRTEVVDWLDNGACLYICGDAKGMARDIRASLVAAYSDVKNVSLEAAELIVAELERQGRYLQDVY